MSYVVRLIGNPGEIADTMWPLAKSLCQRLWALVWIGLVVGASCGQTPVKARLMAQVGSGGVHTCANSPDSRTVLIGGDGGVARLFDIETGRELQSFEAGGSVNYAAVSSDERRVLTVSTNDTKTTVQLWEEISGKELQRISLPSAKAIVGGIAPDLSTATAVIPVDAAEQGRGKQAGPAVSVQLWNVETGKQLQTLRIRSPDVQLGTAVISPDGRKLFTANFDGPRLWDVWTGKQLLRFNGHSEAVESAAFSADGRRVITGGVNSTVWLLDAETGKEIQHFAGLYSGDFMGVVNSVTISPDGSQVLTGSNDHLVRQWSVETGKEVKRFEGHSGPINCAVFLPDGRRVLTGSDDQTVRLWSVDTGKELRRYTGMADGAAFVTFDLQGSRILTTSKTGRSWLWDGETGNVTLLPAWPSTGSVSAVAVSRDGRRMSYFSHISGEQSVWNVETGKEIRHFDAHTFASWSSVYFSSDGRKLLATDGGVSAWLWDIETGKEVQHFVVKARPRLPSSEGYTRDGISSLSLSADGKRALTGDSEGIVRLWDVETGKQLRKFKMSTILPLSLAFSPDGRRMVAGSPDQPSQMWDLATGKVLQRFAGYSNPMFSADGHSLLLGSSVWEVNTGKEVQHFTFPAGYITSGSLSADGQKALIAADDGTMRLWDVKTGLVLANLYSFHDGTWALVDPEGHFDTNQVIGNAALYWVLDSDPFKTLALANFKDGHYAPNLLSHIMKGEKKLAPAD